VGVGKRRFGLALFVIILLIIATITISIIWRRGASADAHASIHDASGPIESSTSFG
jgi:hypothetical protein